MTRIVTGGMVAVGFTVIAADWVRRGDSEVRTATASESATRCRDREGGATEPDGERTLFCEIVDAWDAARREARVVEAGSEHSALPTGPSVLKNTSKMNEEAKKRVAKALAEIAHDYAVTLDEMQSIYAHGRAAGWAAGPASGERIPWP